MAYADIEQLALEAVRQLDSFDTDNTSRGKWGIRNSGKSPHYAVLKPGASTLQWVTFRKYHANWRIIIQLWQRYVDDGGSMEAIEALKDEVVTGIQPERLLNDSQGRLSDTSIAGWGDLQQLPADAPEWLLWEIFLDAREEVEVTFTD